MSISIPNYQHSVNCFFYEKLEEVDFFLNELVNEYVLYKSTSIPRDIKHLNKSRFLFSALLNALFSQWEIVKLSIQLENYSNAKNVDSGLQSEYDLETKIEIFNTFFNSENKTNFEWFNFFKNSRNASTHDGTIALNGGSGDEFRFSSDIFRYKFNKKTKAFVLVNSNSPSSCAITAVISMCVILIPLFEKKLSKINLTNNNLIAYLKENIEVSKLMPPEIKVMAVLAINKKLVGNLDSVKAQTIITQFILKYEKIIHLKFANLALS